MTLLHFLSMESSLCCKVCSILFMGDTPHEPPFSIVAIGAFVRSSERVAVV